MKCQKKWARLEFGVGIIYVSIDTSTYISKYVLENIHTCSYKNYMYNENNAWAKLFSNNYKAHIWKQLEQHNIALPTYGLSGMVSFVIFKIFFKIHIVFNNFNGNFIEISRFDYHLVSRTNEYFVLL